MPLERISQSLYEKCKQIMERTGWKSITYTLDRLTESITPEEFSKVEVEVMFKIKQKVE